MERSKLAREKQLRQDLERKTAELEQRLIHYQEEARVAQQQLRRSEEAAELLAEKSRVAEEEARLLTHKARQAEAEVQRVKKEAAKSEEERIMLERKAREAEDLASKCLNESDRRAQEAKVLQGELLKARHAEKLAKERLAQVLHSTAPVMGLMSPSPVGMSSTVVRGPQMWRNKRFTI
jgi:merlin protein